jgi:hypothetical protein
MRSAFLISLSLLLELCAMMKRYVSLSRENTTALVSERMVAWRGALYSSASSPKLAPSPIWETGLLSTSTVNEPFSMT